MSGLYASVLQEGGLRAGDSIEIESLF
jgi:MOSC domain-containing protein YiiM